MRSNCIVWAAGQYLRHLAVWLRAGRPKGFAPHTVLRPSHLEPWWVFHWQVERWDAKQAVWLREGFEPLDKSPLRPWQLHRAVWFRGAVCRRTVVVSD